MVLVVAVSCLLLCLFFRGLLFVVRVIVGGVGCGSIVVVAVVVVVLLLLVMVVMLLLVWMAVLGFSGVIVDFACVRIPSFCMLLFVCCYCC